MDIVKVFGRNLKKYRTALGLSQERTIKEKIRGKSASVSPSASSARLVHGG